MAQKKKASARATTVKAKKAPSGGRKAAPAKVSQARPAARKAAARRPASKPASARTGAAKTTAKKARPGRVHVAKALPKVAPKAVAAVKALAPASTVKKAFPPPAAVKQRGAALPRSVPVSIGKPASQKISVPVTPRDVAFQAASARQQFKVAKKPVNQRHGFRTNEWIVYPAHGVGRIVGIEEQEIAGMSLELFVIQFEKDKMTLRVPTGKLQSVGMRKLAVDKVVGKALDTLKGRARIKRTMWSRRAQEYEAKINSGDLVAIAEVVRDLYRYETQPEQSYSERQLYEAALDRMAREIAAVDKIDERGAVQRITEILAKSARGRHAAEEAAVANADAEAV